MIMIFSRSGTPTRSAPVFQRRVEYDAERIRPAAHRRDVIEPLRSDRAGEKVVVEIRRRKPKTRQLPVPPALQHIIDRSPAGNDKGATEHQLMATFGWDSPKQAALYTRKADRKKLAGAGMQFIDLGDLDGVEEVEDPDSRTKPEQICPTFEPC